MKVRKICLLGDFGVGKTSLVSRFVHQQFSEKYLTSIGVKIDTKELDLPGVGSIKLVVWDIAGTVSLDALFKRYLQGASAYLLVVDGTRLATLDDALDLSRQVDAQLGALPKVGLLNKADLCDDWEISDQRIQALSETGMSWLRSSAKTGENVEAAFHELATMVSADR